MRRIASALTAMCSAARGVYTGCNLRLASVPEKGSTGTPSSRTARASGPSGQATVGDTRSGSRPSSARSAFSAPLIRAVWLT
jgi:hypothetical protein